MANRTPKRCREPKATRRVHNPRGEGVKAWCTGCKSWKPAAQVPYGQELRNSAGEVTATFAPISHGEGS